MLESTNLSDAPHTMQWPPAFTRYAALSWLLAGMAGQLVMLVMIQGILPALLGVRPPPAALVRAIFSVPGLGQAILLQLSLTLAVLPLVFVYAARPFAWGVLPDMPWWLTGGLFGVWISLGATTALALHGPLPAELEGFTLPVWPGLTAHGAYGVALSGILHWRRS